MTATLEVESTLTDRYQTTVPETVRRALKLGRRDKIHYSIQPDGQIMLKRAASATGEDPVLGQFLSFLARDIEPPGAGSGHRRPPGQTHPLADRQSQSRSQRTTAGGR